MDRQKRYSRVLRSAAEALGSDASLASHLGVSAQQLARWTVGIEPAPFDAFIAGLDVVARGPFARKRRIRIAPLPSNVDTGTPRRKG